MSAHPPNPPLQNPIPGTTLDTSPETLGLTPIEDASRVSAQPATLPSRRSSASKNVLKRTVENTAAKLGGSAFLGSNRRESSGTPVSNRLSASFSATPKRFLSLSRKGKGKEQGSTSGKDISGIIASGEWSLYVYFASFVGDGNVPYGPCNAKYCYRHLRE